MGYDKQYNYNEIFSKILGINLHEYFEKYSLIMILKNSLLIREVNDGIYSTKVPTMPIHYNIVYLSEDKHFYLNPEKYIADFTNYKEGMKYSKSQYLDFILNLSCNIDLKIENILLINEYFKRYYKFNLYEILSLKIFYIRKGVFKSEEYTYQSILKTCGVRVKLIQEAYIFIKFLRYLGLIEENSDKFIGSKQYEINESFILLRQTHEKLLNLQDIFPYLNIKHLIDREYKSNLSDSYEIKNLENDSEIQQNEENLVQDTNQTEINEQSTQNLQEINDDKIKVVQNIINDKDEDVESEEFDDNFYFTLYQNVEQLNSYNSIPNNIFYTNFTVEQNDIDISYIFKIPDDADERLKFFKKHALVSSIAVLKKRRFNRKLFNLTNYESIYNLTTILKYLNLVYMDYSVKKRNIKELISNQIIIPLEYCGLDEAQNLFLFYKAHNNLLIILKNSVFAIEHMSKELNKDYFRIYPSVYITKSPYINLLDNFFKQKRDLLNTKVSLKERSFQIFYDQNFIRNHIQAVISWLNCDKSSGISKILNYIYYQEIENHYSANDTVPQTVLFVENKDTYCTIAGLVKNGQLIFGRKIDSVIFSNGSAAIKKIKTFDYDVHSNIGNEKNTFLFFGDIDYPGIYIYNSMSGRYIVYPFVEGYVALALKYENIVYYPLIENQNNVSCKEFLSYFPKEIADKIVKILESGRYAPQEMVTETDILGSDYTSYSHNLYNRLPSENDDQKIQSDQENLF